MKLAEAMKHAEKGKVIVSNYEHHRFVLKNGTLQYANPALAGNVPLQIDEYEIKGDWKVEPCELLALDIEDLELTVRSTNCLKAEGVSTVADLLNMTWWSIRKIPNLGRKSQKEIKNALTYRGFSLREG